MQKWKQVNKERVMIFSDAIIAIIMTILVLDIKVPVINSNSDEELIMQLTRHLPHLFGFIVSFAVIAVIWMGHHDLFACLKIVSRPLAAINFVFVGIVAIVPFSTALAAEYPGSSMAVALLGGNLLVMNILITAMFLYAAKNGMIDPDYFPIRINNVKRAFGFIGILIFLCATFLAFLSPSLALYLIAVVPLMHCIPLKER